LLLLFCRIDFRSARYTEDAAESDLSSEPVLIDQLNDTAEDDLSREGNLDGENNKFSNDNDEAANGPHDEISSPV
jgi:hypothetical protein